MTQTSKTVAWDRAKFNKRRDAHKHAQSEGAGSFKLTVRPEGELELDTRYAGYMLEYLSEQFRPKSRPAWPQNQGDESTSASSANGSNFGVFGNGF